MGKVSQKAKTSSYKRNNPRGCNVQQSDHLLYISYLEVSKRINIKIFMIKIKIIIN